jgi:hypothetical protein
VKSSRKSNTPSRSQTGAPWLLIALLNLAAASSAHAILAGDETALPADSPANRLDLLGANSQFNAIGSLSINAGGFCPQLDSYRRPQSRPQ